MLTQTTVIFVLAFLAESLTEYLLKPVFGKLVPVEAEVEEQDSDPSALDLLTRYSSALVGVALCVLYQVDVLGMLGLATSVPVVPYVITGLVIGRGSNFVHDFAKRWLGASVLVG
jgi:hypothetical protein